MEIGDIPTGLSSRGNVWGELNNGGRARTHRNGRQRVNPGHSWKSHDQITPFIDG